MRLPVILKNSPALRGTLFSLLFAAFALFAPATASAAEDSIVINFVNADIPSVVKTIGAHTGKTFIIDPRVTGTVNIISQTPVSKDIAYQILLSSLRVSGYAAIEERGVVKIVPDEIGRAHV